MTKNKELAINLMKDSLQMVESTYDIIKLYGLENEQEVLDWQDELNKISGKETHKFLSLLFLFLKITPYFRITVWIIFII